MQLLLSNGIIKNTHKGYVNSRGNHVGHYKTVNKEYIEDRYADEAKTLLGRN